MKRVLVIPARLASTRLPEKPLIEIEGKTVLRRTYEQCIKAFDKELIYVATDSKKIYQHCESLGIQVVMTSEQCLTGTDRVAEFSEKIDADYYINVQGDEPLCNPEDIRKVSQAIDKYPGKIINGFSPIDTESEFRDRNIPKVVVSPNSSLIYMSRSPIPGNKKDQFIKSWRQICIYVFPKESLKTFRNVSSKTPIEKIEDIEILRFIEMGYDVKMIELSGESVAVDTPKDVEKVKKIICSND